MGSEKAEDLPNTPTVTDFLKTDEQRAVWRALTAVDEITRPFALPPGVPSDRVQVLRKAFLDTMSDPDMRAEAAKAGDVLTPSGGERVQRVAARNRIRPGHTRPIEATGVNSQGELGVQRRITEYARDGPGGHGEDIRGATLSEEGTNTRYKHWEDG